MEAEAHQKSVGSSWLESVIPIATYTRHGSLLSIGYALANQRFKSYEKIENWFDEWFELKEKNFLERYPSIFEKIGKLCD